MIILPVGSVYCCRTVEDCYIATWSFLGCSIACLKELNKLIDKTYDLRRRSLLM
jgi:hypothetical protein